MNKFYEYRQDFELMVTFLKAHNVQVGYPVNKNNLPENIKEILHSLDISDVNLNFTKCEGLIDYEFKTNWSNKATLYFSKDSCDKKQSIKGFHDSTHMIEVWGLGDEWIMWLDHDPI